jgi:hypothetical protein
LIEFMVYNGSGVEMAIDIFSSRCVAKPGATCSIRGGEVPIDYSRNRVIYQPDSVGLRKLLSLAENRPKEGYLVRLRFDGHSLLVVSPKGESWAPIKPQPEGFPLFGSKRKVTHNKALHQTRRGGVAHFGRRGPAVEARLAGEGRCYLYPARRPIGMAILNPQGEAVLNQLVPQ